MVYSGVKRSFDNGYWAAGGYFYSPNSTTDRDFSPIIPDTDLHVASLGFGHKGQRWDWALSGQIITGPSREVHNGNVADGEATYGRDEDWETIMDGVPASYRGVRGG